MRLEERDELVKGLRDLADFLALKGADLPVEYPRVNLTSRFYADENDPEATTPKEKMAQAARNLGSAAKDYRSGDFELRKYFGSYVELRFETNRENVCTKKVVGTQLVEEYKTEKTGNMKEVEIVEWECDPLLA